MPMVTTGVEGLTSLPMRGAWIEMVIRSDMQNTVIVAPHGGERGLKYTHDTQSSIKCKVAPHAGSAD